MPMPKPKEPTFDWHPIDGANILACQYGHLRLYVEQIPVMTPAGPAIIHFWAVTESAEVLTHGQTEDAPRARCLAAIAALSIRQAA